MALDPRAVAAALPGYEIGEAIGRGSFGLVLAGRHLHLGREVAIKVLPSELASDEEVRARFVAEARVLASFVHPHIVPIYDYVERDGLCLLVMERLAHGSVWDRFTTEGTDAPTACVVAMATCAALDYAHARGVLHRDVKPANLLLSDEEVLRVTDFGLAQVIGGGDTLVSPGGIVGTPAYMAPEQAGGLELGPEADVYSTGVVLYELLSGHLPFSEEGDAWAVARRHLADDPVPLGSVAPHLGPALDEVTTTALARSSLDRYPSAEAFGVAVGRAATATFGPGWLAYSQLRLMAPGPILASATTAAAGELVVEPDRARSTISYSTAGVSELPPAAGIRARPQVGEHLEGRAEGIVRPAPVSRLARGRRRRALPFVAGAALLLAPLVAYFGLGPGEPHRPSSLEPGQVQIQSGDGSTTPADPASKRPVRLDLTAPIRLSLGPAVGADAREAQLGFSVAGLALPASSPDDVRQVEGQRQASLQASSLRYLVAGEVTGELRLRDEGAQAVERHRFPVTPRHFGLLTVPGALAVALALFVSAYAESLVRALRRSRRWRLGPFVGLVGLGAAAGFDLAVLAWALGGEEPGVGTLTTCTLLGALAGAALAGGMEPASLRRPKPARPAGEVGEAPGMPARRAG